MEKKLRIQKKQGETYLPDIPGLLALPEGEDCVFLIDLGGGFSEPVLGHYEESRGKDLFSQINAFRAGMGLIPLSQVRRYQNYAAIRALEISYLFENERPNGISLSMSENLAMCGEISTNSRILEGWLHSPSHFSNITAPEYQHTGISCFLRKGTDGTYQEYWVQVFG